MNDTNEETNDRFLESGGFSVITTRRSTSFIGTAGVYYVMSELAFHGWHASATHGSAPDIDILVGSEVGEKYIAIQVKSAGHATKTKNSKTYVEFPFSYKAAQINSPNVFFAFVDFGVPAGQRPDVYLLPSTKTNEFCSGWIEKYKDKRVYYCPEADWVKEYKNDWLRLSASGVLPKTEPLDTKDQ